MTSRYQKRKSGKRNERGERFTMLILHTMQEPAWKALSSTAQALYPWLKLEWRGLDNNNNGRLSLSVRQAAAAMGVRPDTAAEAFRDLQRKGFIVQTRQACLGIEGAAKSPEYEVTEIKMPGTEKTQDGRKLYRQWSPGKDFPFPPPEQTIRRARMAARKQNPVTFSVTVLSQKP